MLHTSFYFDIGHATYSVYFLHPVDWEVNRKESGFEADTVQINFQKPDCGGGTAHLRLAREDADNLYTMLGQALTELDFQDTPDAERTGNVVASESDGTPRNENASDGASSTSVSELPGRETVPESD